MERNKEGLCYGECCWKEIEDYAGFRILGAVDSPWKSFMLLCGWQEASQ